MHTRTAMLVQPRQVTTKHGRLSKHLQTWSTLREHQGASTKLEQRSGKNPVLSIIKVFVTVECAERLNMSRLKGLLQMQRIWTCDWEGNSSL